MPKEIGRYQIQEELGQGSMATVYKAYDPRIDRSLAIKILKEEKVLGTDPEYHHRFLQEAKAAGVLSHPNIVPIYDIGEVEDHPYIVMELVEGTPLDKLMQAEPKFPLTEALTIGIQLAEALHYAHSRGIVHRDVKPGNIICLRNQNTIKLTDFGIARMESADKTHQTLAGEVLGTPQYMSPEQVLGKKVDARSDLFAVGVILYQLVTGQRPFNSDSLATLLFKIATDNPKPVGDVAPNIPTPLKKVIDKLLQKKPEKRIQSGRELANELTRILHQLEGRPQAQSHRRRIPLRVKWALIMAIVVSIPMIAGAFYIHHQQQRFLLDQVTGSGSSLAEFLAVQNAIPLLSQDWLQMQTFIDEVAKRQSSNYLLVVDHNGTIRGSNQPEKVNKRYQKLPGAQPVTEINGVVVLSHERVDAPPVFDFGAPVLFQGKEIGRVHLGIPQTAYNKASSKSLYSLLTLTGLAIAVTTIIAYLFARLLSGPVKILEHAFNELRDGNLRHRIAIKRNDELGQLFEGFDEMADALRKLSRHQ